MTVAELMTGKTTNPSFTGFSTADDMVLAVDFSGTATDVNDYIVADKGITEQTGALEAETQESNYLRVGKSTVKTGTSRSFSVNGDRNHGDAFQDALLAHELKFGTGQAVIKPYAYFNWLTGVGETGEASIAVEDDLAGAAGENASFSASITSTTLPVEYTYTPPTP